MTELDCSTCNLINVALSALMGSRCVIVCRCEVVFCENCEEKVFQPELQAQCWHLSPALNAWAAWHISQPHAR